jgi:hypothetical protein
VLVGLLGGYANSISHIQSGDVSAAEYLLLLACEDLRNLANDKH